MVRWDSPLFTVTWQDPSLPTDLIWSAITSGTIKPPNSGTLNAIKAPTDALLTLEATTAAIVSALITAQSLSPGSTVKLDVPYGPTISLPDRNVTLSELQRLKRQFVIMHKKAVTTGTTEKGAVDWDEEQVTSKFTIFLEDHLKS
jgi:protein KTI12